MHESCVDYAFDLLTCAQSAQDSSGKFLEIVNSGIQRTIRLSAYSASPSPETRFQTLVHESAHVMVGHLGPIDVDDSGVEKDPDGRS